MMHRIKNNYQRIAIGIIIFISFLFITLFGFILSVRFGFFGKVPTYSQLEKIEQNNATKIMSADGRLLGLYYYQNRTNTHLEDMPQSLLNGP